MDLNEFKNLDEGAIFLIKARDEMTRAPVMQAYAEFGISYLLSHYTPTFDKHKCRDIANNCVIIFINNIENNKYKPQPDVLTYSYFIQIVRNQANKEVKRVEKDDGITTSLEDENASDDIKAIGEDKIKQEEMETLLLEFIGNAFSRRLRQKCREIIVMKYIRKMRHREIAEELGYTEQFSRNKLYRCKTYLRKAIEKQLGSENMSRNGLLNFLKKNK